MADKSILDVYYSQIMISVSASKRQYRLGSNTRAMFVFSLRVHCVCVKSQVKQLIIPTQKQQAEALSLSVLG